MLRTRFDLLFYAPLPRLDALEPTRVYARVRCWMFDGAFGEDEVAAGEQFRLFKRGVVPPNGMVKCLLPLCAGALAARIDDQLATLHTVG